jgi:Zn-finger domain-containing protein
MPQQGTKMRIKNLPIKKTVIIFLFLSLLSACGGEVKKAQSSEKQVALAFFDAIYNQKDIKKALPLSSTEFKKQLKAYKTASNFARRLLQLQFNSVKMTTAAQKTQIIDEYNSQVTMTIVFTGQRNSGTFKDFRKVRLIKENDTWVVDSIVDNS